MLFRSECVVGKTMPFFSSSQPSVVSQSMDSTDSIPADPDSILDIKKRLERIKNSSRK